jgi:TrpR family trp operon transcriptional repressor
MHRKIEDKASDLAKIFLGIRGVATMSVFLRGLLTEKEIVELYRRIEIVKLLKKGIPQHKIASRLGVGVATVTRGSKQIQMGRFKQL